MSSAKNCIQSRWTWIWQCFIMLVKNKCLMSGTKRVNALSRLKISNIPPTLNLTNSVNRSKLPQKETSVNCLIYIFGILKISRGNVWLNNEIECGLISNMFTSLFSIQMQVLFFSDASTWIWSLTCISRKENRGVKWDDSELITLMQLSTLTILMYLIYCCTLFIFTFLAYILFFYSWGNLSSLVELDIEEHCKTFFWSKLRQIVTSELFKVDSSWKCSEKSSE